MTVKNIFLIIIISLITSSCSSLKHYGVHFTNNSKPKNRRKPIDNTMQSTAALQDRRSIELNNISSYKVKNNAYSSIVKGQKNKNSSDILQYINRNLYIKRSPNLNAFLKNETPPVTEGEVNVL